jgi:hypothetical protein
MPKPPQPAPDGPASPAGEIILYQTEDGRTRVECRFINETLWLSQALMAELFQVTVATVNEHDKNIVTESEVQPGPTIRKFRVVRREGRGTSSARSSTTTSTLSLQLATASGRNVEPSSAVGPRNV